MLLPLLRIWSLLVGREVGWGCEATELDRFVASFLPIFTCSVSLQENHSVMFCILTPLIKYILSDQSQTIQDQIVGGLSEGGWFYVASSRQREKGGRIALRRASSSELVRLLQGFESQGGIWRLAYDQPIEQPTSLVFVWANQWHLAEWDVLSFNPTQQLLIHKCLTTIQFRPTQIMQDWIFVQRPTYFDQPYQKLCWYSSQKPQPPFSTNLAWKLTVKRPCR